MMGEVREAISEEQRDGVNLVIFLQMSAFSGFDFFYRNIYLCISLRHVSVVACRISFGFGTWDLLP